MIGSIVLMQVAASISLSDAPRQPVPREHADLSEAAARIHINKKAFDGWVPKKGTPAPAAPLPSFEEIQPAPEAPRYAARADVDEREPAEPEEGVNDFTAPRPFFFGAPPSLTHRQHHRAGRVFVAPRGPAVMRGPVAMRGRPAMAGPGRHGFSRRTR